MSNNLNDLNDVIEVLEHNAGYLTQLDRYIPADDEAVIRTSAWSHIPPIIRTEDSEIKLWMQNNQVTILDPLVQSSEKLNKKLFEMRRRSQTNSDEGRRQSMTPSESFTPSSLNNTDYHYSYSDISFEMSQMSVNPMMLPNDEDSDDSSTTPESEDSRSEWTPSSFDHSRTTSVSPSLPEPETETRRLSKTQKSSMTKDDLEKRRKDANKKNSKNYNKNKKQKEQDLKAEYEQKKCEIQRMKMEDEQTRNMLIECYSFTGTVVRLQDEEVAPTLIDKDTFLSRLQGIKNDYNSRKNHDVDLRKYAEVYQEKRAKHHEAEKDTGLKKTNTNTYGSRKSRALHSMNIAYLELKRATLEFEKQKLVEKANLMRTVRRQLATIFNHRYAGLEYLHLQPDRRNRFDQLCNILKSDSVTSPQCISFLHSLSTPFPVLLIDNHVLQSLHNEKCEELSLLKTKVAIDSKYFAKNKTNESRFEFFEMNNRTNTDYLQFATQPRRVVPKNLETFFVGNIEIPKNIPKFLEMWKRSVLLKCLSLPVHRNRTKTHQPNHGREAAGKLAALRDVLLQFNMFSFLNGGSLLGWYRECGIIPHTEDMDIAVLARDFRPEIVQYLKSRSSTFKLLRRIGRVNDSFELTITSKDSYPMNIDLFVMYEETDLTGNVVNWVGGASNAEKFKYTYPEYDPWCAADLYGYLFWTTCSPQKILTFEYGNLWYEDVPSSNYDWKRSANNVQRNGLWREEELKQVYVMY